MSYSSEVLADSPVAYWRMDEASGLIQDSSGNSRHATNIFGSGTVTYSEAGAIASDPSSTSIHLNGINFAIPDEAALDFTTTCTLEAWVKRGENGVEHTIFGKGIGGYWLALSTSNTIKVAKQSIVDLAETTATVTADGLFHHVVFTRDASELLFYLDGSLVSSTTYSTAAFDATTASLRIGGTPEGFADYVGHLDECAVYSTKLSASRIAAHYNAAFVSPTLHLVRSTLRW